MAGGTVEPTTGSQGPAETMMAPQAQGVLARLAVTAGPQQGKSFQLKEGATPWASLAGRRGWL